jgi:quercetin dioxygenase-like cupin family protein
MHTEPFVVHPQDRERSLSVVGCGVTVLASNEQTGSYEITLQTGPEGMGPPPHSHPWDEAFFVVEGNVHFVLDGQTRLAETGTLIHIPAGIIHAFQFGAGGGKLLEMTGSGGGATKMFRAVDAEVSPGPPDVGFLVQLLARHRVSVHAPAAVDA